MSAVCFLPMVIPLADFEIRHVDHGLDVVHDAAFLLVVEEMRDVFVGNKLLCELRKINYDTFIGASRILRIAVAAARRNCRSLFGATYTHSENILSGFGVVVLTDPNRANCSWFCLLVF